nr:ribonuclease H-like domain-containing protein [Tanacetum cinerariifolium]
NELQSNIYKNAKLITQLFKRVSDQKDNIQDSSKNTKFAKQPNVEILPKIGETNALSKPVTFNSVSTPQVSKGVNNAKVIAPGMFRISPDKISKEAKHVPNIVSTSSRREPINVSQPNVIIKKNVNSDLNGLSSTELDNTKTRRPQPRSNTKNDRDVISKVVCAVWKKCLNSVNHDVCLNNYVNGNKSRGNLKLLINFVWKFMGTVRFRNDHVAAILDFGNLKLLINFVWKFMGTVRFRNDHVAAILGFGDLQWGNI